MNTDHEHDRFLYEKDGNLHYGCINPFCGHGDPALPNRWKVPTETDCVKMRIISHEERKIFVELTWKIDHLGHKEGETQLITMPDNLEDDKAEFAKLFQK